MFIGAVVQCVGRQTKSRADEWGSAFETGSSPNKIFLKKYMNVIIQFKIYMV